MKNMPFDDVGAIEKRLLAVFERHGLDGRAITIDSLAANVGMPKHARELAVALRNLAARGAIQVAGQDPLPGAPLAFRLAKPSSGHENVEAVRDLPRRPSPPLSPVRRTDRSMTAVNPNLSEAHLCQPLRRRLTPEPPTTKRVQFNGHG
jgi:hypothetical protein